MSLQDFYTMLDMKTTLEYFKQTLQNFEQSLYNVDYRCLIKKIDYKSNP